MFQAVALLIGLLSTSSAMAIDVPSFLNRLMEPEKVSVTTFSSMITDPLCEKPVDPFDIPNQFVTLSKITGIIAYEGGDYRKGLAVAKTMNWLPVDTEVMLGEKMHESHMKTIIRRGAKNKRYIKLYAKVDKVLEDVVNGLPEELPFDIRLFITTDRGVNASAQPGGFIYITKEAAGKSNDFLAILLSHELFHVAQRHTTRQYQATIIDTIDSFQRFKGLLGSGGSIKEIGSLALLTAKIMGTYGVQQEEQADVCAGRLVGKMAGYNASKGVNRFLAISATREDSRNPMFASHPSPKKRKEIYSAALNKPMKGKAGLHGKGHSTYKAKQAKITKRSKVFANSNISTLLKRASSQISANKLTSPEGDSAYETYQFILEKEPNNAKALKGINDIATQYVVWGESSLTKGDTDKGRMYLEKAKRVDASHAGIKKLNKNLGGEEQKITNIGEKLGAELDSLAKTMSGALTNIFN